jgi:small subunit ribosomal protein S5
MAQEQQEQRRGGGGSGGERGGERGGGERRGGGGKGGGKGGSRGKKEEKEITYQERVIQIRRVSKVVKGGKKLSFRAIVVIGNEKGEVGVGVGKASDVIGAVRKGVADGKKHLITIPLTKSNTIPHPIVGGGGGANVMMRPAAPGTGVIAGGAVRTVLELAGVKNILAKQLGSGNPLNNARAAVNALKTLRSFNQVAEDRGVTVESLFA